MTDNDILNRMLAEANFKAGAEIADMRVARAKELIDAYGPVKLANMITGVKDDLTALAYVAVLGTWASDENIVRTAVFTAFALGKEMGQLDNAYARKESSVSKSDDNSQPSGGDTGVLRVRENE